MCTFANIPTQQIYAYQQHEVIYVFTFAAYVYLYMHGQACVNTRTHLFMLVLIHIPCTCMNVDFFGGTSLKIRMLEALQIFHSCTFFLLDIFSPLPLGMMLWHASFP